MESVKICSVFGHRKVNNAYYLKKVLYSLFYEIFYNLRINEVWFGGLSEFDELCWQVVTDLKNKYNLKIERVLCLWDARYLRVSKRPKWLKDDDYERLEYLSFFDYWKNRIFFRNRAMIDSSDFLVFYVGDNKEKSGARSALEYAKKCKKNYINIYSK